MSPQAGIAASLQPGTSTVVIFIFGGFAQADVAMLIARTPAMASVNNCFCLILVSTFFFKIIII